MGEQLKITFPEDEKCIFCKKQIRFHTEEEAEGCAYALGYSRNDEGAK